MYGAVGLHMRGQLWGRGSGKLLATVLGVSGLAQAGGLMGHQQPLLQPGPFSVSRALGQAPCSTVCWLTSRDSARLGTVSRPTLPTGQHKQEPGLT